MGKRIFFACMSVLFLFGEPNSVQSTQFGGDEKNPFVVGYDDGPIQVFAGQNTIIPINFQIPEGGYLYADSLNVTLGSGEGITLRQINKPPTELKEDPFQGKMVPVYHNEVILEVGLQMPSAPWPGTKTIKGDIQFQGCANELCYKMMHVPLAASFTAVPAVPPPSSKVENGRQAGFLATLSALLENPDFTRITGKNFWLFLFLSFLGGLLTDLTPCVWPLIPVTLAIIGVRKEQSVGKNLVAVGVMVGGMAVMYSVLGVAAALLGKSLGFFFQSLAFLVLLEIVLLAMAASLLGLFHFQLPPRLQTFLGRISASGFRGVFLIGLTMGFLAAPCVGPVVGPLLVFVARTQDIFAGFFLLLSYAIGMGFLFIVLGGFYGILKLKIRGGGFTVWTKRVLGVLLLAVAFYYGQTLYAEVTSSRHEKGALSPLSERLQAARAGGKPVVIDFFARWCPPCIELDRKVWKDKEVHAELKANWVFVKIDCTKDTPECREAVDAFDVVGWPTIVVLDKNQRRAEKLVGKVVSPQEMIKILNQVKKQ